MIQITRQAGRAVIVPLGSDPVPVRVRLANGTIGHTTTVTPEAPLRLRVQPGSGAQIEYTDPETGGTVQVGL
ncbi:hypothetical protein QOL99_00120 [Deinococcus sp. MIMF12]|uniref:Uncharacterized protein n=1 Tax=Deinococcus rhizophilus TaxID=3049544 RepID=A0ABT7JBX7_9DEIO|nr:hypothetical protein [Deinococcus rhizophilus]MDL2342553.1 hypothetical protein [Deinococcus rhizophilus]